MTTPKITRPKFPKGYVDNLVSYVDWDWVAAQLTESRHYWLSSVRPNGKPHIVPRWAVYVDGKIYYDGSPETRHARNIETNPNICVNLESGSEVIMLEGTSRAADKPSPELAKRLSTEYKRKYKELEYAPEPDSWDGGGLFVFIPRHCIAWTKFNENPTKFVFEK